jgi:glutathione S-transferase
MATTVHDGATTLSPMNMKPTTEQEIQEQLPLRVARMIINTFSRVGQREPPSPEKTEHVRLISIAVSHYVEKARWALDLLEARKDSPVYYTEDLHAPAFSSYFTVPASKNKASQTPMLVRSNDNVMWGSDTILRALCSGENGSPIDLYPYEVKEEITTLEDELGRRVGASGRCFAYGVLLDKSKKYYGTVIKMATKNCSKVEQKVFEKMFDKGIDKALVNLMNISDGTLEASENELRKVFAELSDRLEKNGGEYLMDTPNRKFGFTAADLTLASLVYFIVRPPEVEPLMLSDDEFPPKLLELFNELAASKAGQHVLKVYKKHRPVDGQGKIVLKNVNQNRNPFKCFN